MTRYEYKVIPAPRRGEKVRGAKHPEDRFAHALASLMNRMGREGWEYQRAETLPCEERSGLTGRSTTFQNMLIFRRALAEDEVEATAEDTLLRAAAPEPAALREIAGPVRDTSPRSEGPRLVSSRADEGGKAPAVGPASGESPAE